MNVFLTGHIGFKNAWMLLYSNLLEYKSLSFSISPAKNSLFKLGSFKKLPDAHTSDAVHNKKLLTDCMVIVELAIVIHFTAQSQVLKS